MIRFRSGRGSGGSWTGRRDRVGALRLDPGPGGGGGDIDFGLKAGLVVVGGDENFLEVLDVIGGKKGDGATAEAAAGHAATIGEAGLAGDFDDGVEFGARDFEIVAEAFVGLIEELAGVGPVVLMEGVDEVEDALVFGDVVADAAGYGVGELGGGGLICLGGNVAKGGRVGAG